MINRYRHGKSLKNRNNDKGYLDFNSGSPVDLVVIPKWCTVYLSVDYYPNYLGFNSGSRVNRVRIRFPVTIYFFVLKNEYLKTSYTPLRKKKQVKYPPLAIEIVIKQATENDKKLLENPCPIIFLELQSVFSCLFTTLKNRGWDSNFITAFANQESKRVVK